MKLKKFFVTVILLVTGISLFAQSADYNALLQKAKEFESKKQFVYALGTYYDAIAAEPSESSKEAQNAFNTLIESIRQGNPGSGDFDEFELYDNWVVFLKEYEKYFTENSPKAISFGTLKRESIDRTTKTGNYSVAVSWDWTAKYKRISQAVLAGLKEVWQSDWTGIPKDWPKTSVYASEFKEGTYLKDGVALWYQNLRECGGYYFDQKIIVAAALAEEGWLWASNDLEPYKKFSLNDIKFTVNDLSGKVLLTSSRLILTGTAGTYSSTGISTYTFKGVSQETMKLIDGGKVKIVPVGLYLEYGHPAKSTITEDRAWLKPLPELTLDVKNAVWGG